MYLKAWKQICDVSRAEFDKVYERLGIRLEEMAESFFNDLIPPTLEKLNQLGLIKESDGARVIFVEGVEKPLPLIAVKKDGGYNYNSTDLASLWYRLNVEQLDWNIYVTDVGQLQHFDMLFKVFRHAGKACRGAGCFDMLFKAFRGAGCFDMLFKAFRGAGWLPQDENEWLPQDENEYPKCTHIGFGLVLGEDGKRFRTRSSEVVRLVDLLDEAKSRCKTALLERDNARNWTEEEIERTSEAIGYGAVKYADLKINRLTNYTFNFDHMLNDKGNTAVYLLYAHARICSIIRKSGKDIEELKRNGTFVLDHQDERALGLHLLQFTEVFVESCSNLLPHVLCEYLYNLAEIFTKKFYSNCQVVDSPDETSCVKQRLL